MMKKLILAMLAGMILATSAQATTNNTNFNPSFPRLMCMNIGGGNYASPTYQAKLAKCNVDVLTFIPESSLNVGAAIDAIKAINPKTLVLQYEIFEYAPQVSGANTDSFNKVTAEDWWLRNADGTLATATNPWNVGDLNITQWATRDANGDHFPQWLAKRNESTYLAPLPQLDGVYMDLTNIRPTKTTADWKRNGTTQLAKDLDVGTSYRQGHAEGWATHRALNPNALLVGNVGASFEFNPVEFNGKMNGGYLEGMFDSLHNPNNSLEFFGIPRVLSRYKLTMQGVSQPKLVGFGVRGLATEYKFMRYAFTTCLMGDGYFSYSNDYNDVILFDEYNVDLGKAITKAFPPAQTAGHYYRMFEKGIVVMNPTAGPITFHAPSGYHYINGTQDHTVNKGGAAVNVTVPSKDGIIILKD